MFYKFGTQAEALTLRSQLPPPVLAEVFRCTALLDQEYRPGRDYMECGGYVLFAETADDLQQVNGTFDPCVHPPEWVRAIGGDYLSSLYLLNDDFSVQLVLPRTIAPEIITQELEEPT